MKLRPGKNFKKPDQAIFFFTFYLDIYLILFFIIYFVLLYFFKSIFILLFASQLGLYLGLLIEGFTATRHIISSASDVYPVCLF